MNNQSRPGNEANLDVQFALGISFPTPGTFYSTGGRAPFNPDKDTTINTNEPYMTVLSLLPSRPANYFFELLVSGWTLFLHKRESLRPSQQVMVMMSKQASFILFLFFFDSPRASIQYQ